MKGCRSQLKYCGNTTNLISHLKTQHPQVYLKAGFELKKRDDKKKATAARVVGQPSIIESLEDVTKFPAHSRKSKELTDAVGLLYG